MTLTQSDITAIADIVAQKLTASLGTTTPGRWLSMAEGTRYARMSKNTLMSCINSGDIRASKRRGKWIVDRDSIDEYYEADHEAGLYQDIAKRIGL